MKQKNLIFDLDATLYYVGDQIEKLCDEKVVSYFARKLNLNNDEAANFITELRRHYAYDVDALEGEFPFSKKEFMDEICNVDVSCIQPDPRLNDLLKSLPQFKYILTDSTRRHVSDTLQALQIDEDLFVGVFDADDMNYTFKYNPQSFHSFLQKYHLNAEDCVLFEDSKTNIKTAKKLGFTTVLIRPENMPDPNADYYFPNIAEALEKLFELNE